MYAIVSIKGVQYKVSPKQKIFTPLLDSKAEDLVEFENVLLYKDDTENIEVGEPYLSHVKVSAKVIAPKVKADKVIIFKKKRRKGYQKRTGHRQKYTQIKIQDIIIS